MHKYTLEKWQHDHNFVSINKKGEIRTKQVLILTVITMIAEVIAGIVFGSMALLADGWHMGTHSAAFAITIFAYRYSIRHSDSRRFTFGPGKVSCGQQNFGHACMESRPPGLRGDDIIGNPFS
ncbi:MAG: cation transporter [Proteobacteria bacterium]|nr:cation transporter [Pseudomonadota bacterium]